MITKFVLYTMFLDLLTQDLSWLVAENLQHEVSEPRVRSRVSSRQVYFLTLTDHRGKDRQSFESAILKNLELYAWLLCDSRSRFRSAQLGIEELISCMTMPYIQ